MTGTITFTNCKLAALIETSVSCSYGLTPQAFTGTSVTDGIADMHCTVALQTSPFTGLCTITGTTPGAYHNPNSPTKGQLTLLSSPSLTVHNVSGSSCSAFGVPAGGSRFGDLTPQTINITNGTPTTLGPIISSP